MTDPYLLHERLTDARSTSHGRDADRVDRRERRRRGSNGNRARRVVGATTGDIRRRHLHRLPRPATDDGVARRRQRTVGVVPTSRCTSVAIQSATTC